MKYLLYILAVILLALCYTWLLESRDKERLQQSEIEALRKREKRNALERDSLELSLKLTRDSLEIAYSTIRQATVEREAAHERSQRTIANLRKIIFIQHSDSSRNAELKQLYKSYTP